MAKIDTKDSRGYSSSMFMLEIEGKSAGFLKGVEGGGPFAAVTSETDTDGVVRKRLDPVQYQPISMSFGTGMTQELYQWMTDFLSRKSSAKQGAIVFCDYNLKEQSRLVFDNATITELTFPALELGSKDSAYFTLTVQPGATSTSFSSAGSSISGFGARNRKAWSSGNFLLTIKGLEAAAARVRVIDAITVKQTLTRGDGGVSPVLTIPDLVLTIPKNQAKPFYDYFEQFVVTGNPNDERRGTLEFRDKNPKTSLFTLVLSNLGIFRIEELRLVTDVEVVSRVSIALYCEEMRLKTAAESIGALHDPAPPPVPPPTPPMDKANIQLSETILGIIGGRIRGEESIRAALGAAALQQTTNSDVEAESALVARRLLETARAVKPGPSVSLRDDGSLLGEQWATERATLAELEQVAALDEGEWTAIRLENGHSLIAQLSEAGVISADASDALDLERDSFVEGVVAGAVQVLRNAAPHLNVPPTQE